MDNINPRMILFLEHKFNQNEVHFRISMPITSVS